MDITVKLFATLTDYLPAQARYSNEMRLGIPPETSVADIIDLLHLPTALVHLVLVNGRYIEPAKRPVQTLNPDDVLAIWPPIAGG